MILVMIIFIVGISGCTEKKATNGTWGEKPPVTADSLQIINSTSEQYTDKDGNPRYAVYGYIQNNAEEDASNVKITVNAYGAEGNVIATNDSAYIKPKNVSAKGQSYYAVTFNDSNNKIVKYDIKITITN